MAFGLGTASNYATTFRGTGFVPKTLGEAGILSKEATDAMTMIPALNLEAETALTKQGLINDANYTTAKLLADTRIQLDELAAERAKKNTIANLLFAGTGNPLGLTNSMNRGIKQRISEGVVNNSGGYPAEALKLIDKEDVTGMKKVMNKVEYDKAVDMSGLNVTNEDIDNFNKQFLSTSK
jgi:hypothetical protein